MTKMTFSIGVSSDNTDAKSPSSFVELQGRCVLVRGSVSISEFNRLTKMAPKASIMSPHLARIAGCTMAFGLKADVEALVKEMEPGALARGRQTFGKMDLSPEAVWWLSVGERGASSNAMFLHLAGLNPCDIDRRDADAHPADPDDLRRCRLLLELVPELAEKLSTMAEVSSIWSRLIAQWQQLCDLMDEETPTWRIQGGRAPQSYALMQEIIESGEQRAHVGKPHL